MRHGIVAIQRCIASAKRGHFQNHRRGLGRQLQNSFTIHYTHSETTMANLASDGLATGNVCSGIQVGSKNCLLSERDAVCREEYAYIAVDVLFVPIDHNCVF